MQDVASLRGYERRPGAFPVVFAPQERDAAERLRSVLETGAAALEDFGEGFLKVLAHALREERDVVDEERAEELLTDALGPGGREWLSARPEYQG